MHFSKEAPYVFSCPPISLYSTYKRFILGHDNVTWILQWCGINPVVLIQWGLPCTVEPILFGLSCRTVHIENFCEVWVFLLLSSALLSLVEFTGTLFRKTDLNPSSQFHMPAKNQNRTMVPSLIFTVFINSILFPLPSGGYGKWAIISSFNRQTQTGPTLHPAIMGWAPVHKIVVTCHYYSFCWKFVCSQIQVLTTWQLSLQFQLFWFIF